MADQRYIRWQGIGITQLSVAVALISSLSLAALGAGFGLLQKPEFLQAVPSKLAFGASQALLFCAAFFATGAVLTRLLDFRLTARQVRTKTKSDYDKPTVLFGCDAEAYGQATWRLFWASALCFYVGAVVFAASVGAVYMQRLL